MNKSNNEFKFCAGIVLYNPESLSYLASVRLLLDLDIAVFIYDNSSSESIFLNNKNILENEFPNSITILNRSFGNIGLASAFNLIVKLVLDSNEYDSIFLFDQDTSINEMAVNKLMSSFKDLSLNKSPFGIIAGYPYRSENEPYRIRPLNKYKILPDLVQVQTVSSSFSLIPMETFRKIGIFREDFFIDHIDMDFAMRSWNGGLPVYVNSSAKFIHNIGIGNVFLFNKFLFPFGHDYRHYYQVRNMILSFRANNTGNIKILKEILIRTIVVGIISLNAGGVKTRFKYLFNGIGDGFKGISGKMPVPDEEG